MGEEVIFAPQELGVLSLGELAEQTGLPHE